MSTILIVANQTLPSEALATEVRRRIGAGAREFHVVVPASPPPGSGFTWDEDVARALGQEARAARTVTIREAGVTAAGEIGDRDPVQAVRDAARDRDVREVICSTLPAGVSRWLRQDVPSGIRDALAVPVAVVIEREASAARR